MGYIMSKRDKKKHEAADIIRDFFHEVHDVSKLWKVIKKFRQSVSLAQRVMRKFIQVYFAQVELVLLQWNNVEPVWWGQRKQPKSREKEIVTTPNNDKKRSHFAS
jgi:hypothetical protein